MRRTYEVRSGPKPIGLKEASTAQEALLDYVRSRGARENEIMRLGANSLSWRGAVYRAVLAPSDVPGLDSG